MWFLGGMSGVLELVGGVWDLWLAPNLVLPLVGSVVSLCHLLPLPELPGFISRQERNESKMQWREGNGVTWGAFIPGRRKMCPCSSATALSWVCCFKVMGWGQFFMVLSKTFLFSLSHGKWERFLTVLMWCNPSQVPPSFPATPPKEGNWKEKPCGLRTV